MEKIAPSLQSLTDEMYRVSANDIADKIIQHMWRGWNPRHMSSHSLPPMAIAPMMETQSRKKLSEQ